MEEPDFARQYGRNPYVSYDSSTKPFLYSGENPPHGIPALERVVRVGDRAWPLTRLSKLGAVTENGVSLILESRSSFGFGWPQYCEKP